MVCAAAYDDVNTQREEEQRHDRAFATGEKRANCRMPVDGKPCQAPDSDQNIKRRDEHEHPSEVAVREERCIDSNVVTAIGECDYGDAPGVGQSGQFSAR